MPRVLRGNLEIALSTLLEHGANPNATITQATGARRYSQDWSFGDDLVGATRAFTFAARFAEIPIMRALAAHGRTRVSRCPTGSTAVMAAMDTAQTRSGEFEGFGVDRRGRTSSRGSSRAVSRGGAEGRAGIDAACRVASGADVNASGRDRRHGDAQGRGEGTPRA